MIKCNNYSKPFVYICTTIKAKGFMQLVDWTNKKPEVLTLKCVNDALTLDGYEFSPFIDDESVNNFLYKITVEVKDEEKIIKNTKVVFQIAVRKGRNIGGIITIGDKKEFLTTENKVNNFIKEWVTL